MLAQRAVVEARPVADRQAIDAQDSARPPLAHTVVQHEASDRLQFGGGRQGFLPRIVSTAFLLWPDGVVFNRKRTQRVYRELGLAVRSRRGRQRAVGTRAPILVAAAPNARWSLDFVHDQPATGKATRILTVVISSRAMRRWSTFGTATERGRRSDARAGLR